MQIKCKSTNIEQVGFRITSSSINQIQPEQQLIDKCNAENRLFLFRGRSHACLLQVSKGIEVLWSGLGYRRS